MVKYVYGETETRSIEHTAEENYCYGMPARECVQCKVKRFDGHLVDLKYHGVDSEQDLYVNLKSSEILSKQLIGQLTTITVNYNIVKTQEIIGNCMG